MAMNSMFLYPQLQVRTRRCISPTRTPAVGTAAALLKHLRLPTRPLGITNAKSLLGLLSTPHYQSTKLESASAKWHQPALHFEAMAQITISPTLNNFKSTHQHQHTV